MYRMNASGPVGQTGGMNIHINPYDQSYLYSTTSSGINSGHISLSSPYSTGTGGAGGHIYSGGTTLNRHMATSNSGHHSSLTNGNVTVGPVSACSSGNLALNQPPSTSLLHSVTSSQSAVAAAVTASTAPPGAMATASSMTTTGSSAFGGQIHASQISSSPGTQLTGRTNSTHGITSNLLHSHSSSSSPHHHSHPHTHHHQQASSSTQSPSVVFNGGPSMVTMVNGTSASGMVNGSVSNSNNNSTHQMLPSTLDTSSPSDAPQKKTFYVLIILIAIGITVMVITVITAIVIFFKCKLPLLIFLLNLNTHLLRIHCTFKSTTLEFQKGTFPLEKGERQVEPMVESSCAPFTRLFFLFFHSGDKVQLHVCVYVLQCMFQMDSPFMAVPSLMLSRFSPSFH